MSCRGREGGPATASPGGPRGQRWDGWVWGRERGRHKRRLSNEPKWVDGVRDVVGIERRLRWACFQVYQVRVSG